MYIMSFYGIGYDSTDDEIKDILNTYPGIKDKLAKLDPKFGFLNLPMGDMLLGDMTIGGLCEKTGFSFEDVVAKIKSVIGK